MENGFLLQCAVKGENMEAFRSLADAVDAVAAKAIPLYPDATGRSIVRVAVDAQNTANFTKVLMPWRLEVLRRFD